MATLSDQQVALATRLTTGYKARQNREAARIAALIAVYYQTRVDPASAESVDSWLELMIPRLIRRSDASATESAQFFMALRRIELGVNAPPFTPEPVLGAVDDGVRKSLMAIGPGDFMNKATDIRGLDVDPQQKQAMLAEAKQVTTTKIASAVLRHAQAGGRETIHRNAAADETALGWVRVTKADPCFFCAMLASRGLAYRPFKEFSFDLSDQRFTGDGDAKVHDNCGCSLKPVYAENDPMVERTKQFADMWSMWGAGGGDAATRFRRGYEHFRKTGEYLTWEQADTSPGSRTQ